MRSTWPSPWPSDKAHTDGYLWGTIPDHPLWQKWDLGFPFRQAPLNPAKQSPGIRLPVPGPWVTSEEAPKPDHGSAKRLNRQETTREWWEVPKALEVEGVLEARGLPSLPSNPTGVGLCN